MTKRVPKHLPLDGDADELALQRAGFEALRAGEVLSAVELGSRAGFGPQRSTELVDVLLGRESITVADDGRVDGIAGLTVRPTRHQLVIDGHARYTWCAFDTVGIAAALGSDAVAVTSCGHCQASIQVRFAAGETPPSELRGWLPEMGTGDTQLITNFCAAADLFCNLDHLEAWRGRWVSAGGCLHDRGTDGDRASNLDPLHQLTKPTGQRGFTGL